MTLPQIYKFSQAVPKMKELSLDLIHLLVDVYQTKYQETNDDKLQWLTLQLFPPRKLLLAQHECVDLYADLIATIAKGKMDFAMHNIVFELLKTENSMLPEYLFIRNFYVFFIFIIFIIIFYYLFYYFIYFFIFLLFF